MAAYYKVGRDRYWIPTNFNSWTNSTFGPQHALVNMSYGQVNYHVNVQANHGQLIRQIGSSSIVLLKNNGALPLTGHEVFTGIFGEDAGATPGGPNACADRSCDSGTLAMGWGSGTAQFPYLITPEEAIQTKVQSLGTGTVQAITDNNALSQMAEVASRARYLTHFVRFLNEIDFSRIACALFSVMPTLERDTLPSTAMKVTGRI
jgi:beta-glucosidase